MTDNNGIMNPNPPSTPDLNMNPQEPRTEGYAEVVKKGNNMKLAILVVIFLILALLVGYIVMNYMGTEETPPVEVTPTTVTTLEPTMEQSEPTLMPTEEEVGTVEFSYPVFIPDTKDSPYTVSGTALGSAELIPVSEDDVAGFTIRGADYQLNVGAYFEVEKIAYEDFQELMVIGDETVARVKDTYLLDSQHPYRYIRTENFESMQDCQGTGLGNMLSAPCGYSHYVRGNEVQTFYILDITCDADEENVSKCDEIVKSLNVAV